MSPPNLYVKTLIPSMIIFGDEAFGRSLGHEGGAFMMGLVPLEEKTQKMRKDSRQTDT